MRHERQGCCCHLTKVRIQFMYCSIWVINPTLPRGQLSNVFCLTQNTYCYTVAASTRRFQTLINVKQYISHVLHNRRIALPADIRPRHKSTSYIPTSYENIRSVLSNTTITRFDSPCKSWPVISISRGYDAFLTQPMLAMCWATFVRRNAGRGHIDDNMV